MEYLDLTLGSPPENLACDEALLDECETREGAEVLRFWEPDSWFVVLGYGNCLEREVAVARCHADRIPIYRRCSGGGAVLQGPGCLNYTLVLRATHHPARSSVTAANRLVMNRQAEAFKTLLSEPVDVRGHTDLVVGERKFSGNAQRRRRQCFLFHGTILLRDMTAEMETYLRLPSRQPEYRAGRSHSDFLTWLPFKPDRIKRVLKSSWGASRRRTDWPVAAVASLVNAQYGNPRWIERG